MSRLAALLALLLLLAAAGAASAGEDDTAAAREHYQKGTSYYDLGRYPEAIKEFEAAYELKNDPALLYNLAQSHRLAGNTEQALHFYRTYLRRVPKATNRAEIEGRITALEQALAQKGTAGTGTTPPGQTPPGQSGPPPPGGGTTTSSGDSGNTGAPPPGGTGMTPPPPPPQEGVPPPPGTYVSATPAPARGPGRTYRYIGMGAAGAGALLFIVGLIEGGRAAAAASEIDKTATDGGTFDPAVQRRGQSAESAEKGLIVTGILLGAAGGGLYYYGRRTDEQAARQVSVTPVASAHGAGALLRVTF